jgi:hypothetical protein
MLLPNWYQTLPVCTSSLTHTWLEMRDKSSCSLKCPYMTEGYKPSGRSQLVPKEVPGRKHGTESSSSGTPHSHPMFISSLPPISAHCQNLGVANLFCTLFRPVSAQSAQYPKTPRFLHIYAAFEPFSLIRVYSSLVLFFKTTNRPRLST